MSHCPGEASDGSFGLCELAEALLNGIVTLRSLATKQLSF